MRYLGVDFGLKRTGLAISEGELASPWQIIAEASLNSLAKRISELATQGGVGVIVIGTPESGKVKDKISKLSQALKKRGFRVELIEETLSTKRSQDLMVSLGIPREKRKKDDAYSAALILQSYLDEKREPS